MFNLWFESIFEVFETFFSCLFRNIFFLRNVLFRVFNYAEMFWKVFKCFLIIIVVIVTFFVFYFNVFVTIYTIIHDSFFNNFCTKKLLVMRNILCNNWNRLLLKRNAHNTKQKNFNQFFDNYFKNGNSILSYEFFYYLNHFEFIIRTFKFSFSKLKYFFNDQKIFRKKFINYIN